MDNDRHYNNRINLVKENKSMNGLSIALWIADIVVKLSIAIYWIAGLTIAAIIITNLIIIVSRAEDKKPFKEFVPVAKNYLFMSIIAILISTIIPSQNTIYLIAGSEIGETVITSPENVETMSKVRELVNTKLDEMIASETDQPN